MGKMFQLSALALLCGASLASAAPVTINTPYINLENRGINSIGFTSGQFMRIGANSVTPNGSAGTIGVGTHALPDGSTATRNISFIPSPLNPNFFQRLFLDAPALRGDWRLTFTNGADSAFRDVNISSAATQTGFVNSITLSGNSLTPTFTWSPPKDTTVNAYRVNIYDKSLITPGNSGQVMNLDLPAGTTSYTVSPADFRLPGYEFNTGKNYAIEISAIQTKDNTGNSNNSNVQAISRTYADFTPNDSGLVVNLPVVLENGAFKFDISVQPGVIYYIDPEVAIGYDYETGIGDPNFASLDLPEGIGDGLFDIFGFNAAGDAVLLADDWAGLNVFTFASGGVSKFRVMGIETSAGLDPLNTTAFITGVSFTDAGRFTGTQTPITVTLDVPEPPALALVGIALAGLGFMRRRKA